MMKLSFRPTKLLVPFLAVTHGQNAVSMIISTPVPETTSSLYASISPSGNQTNSLFERSIEAGFIKLLPYTTARIVWSIDGRADGSPIPGPASFRLLTLTAYDPQQWKLFVTTSSATSPLDWSAPTSQEPPPASGVYGWEWDSLELNLRGALFIIARAGHPGPFRHVRYLWPKRDPFTTSSESEPFIGFSPDTTARNVVWYLVGTKSGRTGTTHSFDGSDMTKVGTQDANSYSSS